MVNIINTYNKYDYIMVFCHQFEYIYHSEAVELDTLDARLSWLYCGTIILSYIYFRYKNMNITVFKKLSHPLQFIFLTSITVNQISVCIYKLFVGIPAESGTCFAINLCVVVAMDALIFLPQSPRLCAMVFLLSVDVFRIAWSFVDIYDYSYNLVLINIKLFNGDITIYDSKLERSLFKSSNVVLSVKHLSKILTRDANRTHIFDDVSFSIVSNQKIVLLVCNEIFK